MATFYYIPDENSILHHGVKGQHWGERRYQNKDGSLTPEGYKHWGVSPDGGKRITSTGRGKNAVKIANAMAKREKQQKKLDKAVRKAEKTGDSAKIAEAKKNANSFREAGKGFTKSMNQSLKGTTAKDLENYLHKNGRKRAAIGQVVGGAAGIALATIATGGVGGVAAVGVAAGGVVGGASGRIGAGISQVRRRKRVNNTVASLRL